MLILFGHNIFFIRFERRLNSIGTSLILYPEILVIVCEAYLSSMHYH